jgi:thymidylate kinase
VHAGYHAEAARSPDRVVLVDATGGIDEVAARIRRVVAERFAELA